MVHSEKRGKQGKKIRTKRLCLVRATYPAVSEPYPSRTHFFFTSENIFWVCIYAYPKHTRAQYIFDIGNLSKSTYLCFIDHHQQRKRNLRGGVLALRRTMHESESFSTTTTTITEKRGEETKQQNETLEREHYPSQ